MNKLHALIVLTYTALLLVLIAVLIRYYRHTPTHMNPPEVQGEETIHLPEPKLTGDISVEQALQERRSVREYSDKPLSLDEVSQLVWAAQGITGEDFGRTAPSAGALYPLELYVVVGNVSNVASGIYKYVPHNHTLVRLMAGDKRKDLSQAALGQECVGDGAVSLVFTGIYERTTQKYGDRGVMFVHIETGHAAQNVYLQAVALNLGTVVIGGFNDEQVATVLNLPTEERPLYIMPVGKKKE